MWLNESFSRDCDIFESSEEGAREESLKMEEKDGRWDQRKR